MRTRVASTRLRGWWLAITVAAVMLSASVVRVPGEPSPTPSLVGLTDLFHLVGYAVLAAAVTLALSENHPVTRGSRSRAVAVGVAVAVATLFGIGVELIQAPITWRSFAVADAAVNAVGAVVGVTVLGGWRRWRRSVDGDDFRSARR